MMEELNYKEMKECCMNMDTLVELDKRAEEDLNNNTHNISQKEVLTIIREFIRCKNDYKNIGKIVTNTNNNKRGIVTKEFKTGQVQVVEKLEPLVICTHDSWKTLIEEE